MTYEQHVERVGDKWAATCDHGEYVWYLERGTEYNAWRSLRAHVRHVHAAATDQPDQEDRGDAPRPAE